MCKHIRYRYGLCRNRFNYKASKLFCIAPCAKAYDEQSEVDHEWLNSCPDNKIEVVRVHSGCCFRRDDDKSTPCWWCKKMGPLEANDPGFEEWIEQGRPGKLGNTLPKMDEMVWYIPAMKMTLPSLNDFTWDQPSNKRKRDDEDDATSEPLSPKSKVPKRDHMDGESYEKVATTTQPPPKDGLLTSMLRRCTFSNSSSSETTTTTTAGAGATSNPFEKPWSWSTKPDNSDSLSSTETFITANFGTPPSSPHSVTAITKPRGLSNGSRSIRVSSTRARLEEQGKEIATAFKPVLRFARRDRLTPEDQGKEKQKSRCEIL